MSSHLQQAVVIDNGTGYTKMGYAGNAAPQFTIPTTITSKKRMSPKDDFDFNIGDDCQTSNANTTGLHSPIRHGVVESWEQMEAYWQHCFFRYLRCDPGLHPVLLTEPPLNPPENREYTAEIMFESFNVPSLYIGVQAVMALFGSIGFGDSETPLTGTVVDSGDGVTHIIPVVDGYAIGSAIKHVPIAGREVTLFIQQLLRDRPDLKGVLSPDDLMRVSRLIKEQLCYVCSDPVKELLKYDANPEKFIQFFNEGKIAVGQERFLAPEIFFNPEMVITSNTNSGGFTTPLPVLIDQVIQQCPIDCRRPLYKNIVLSGGSTMFRDMNRRIQKDLKAIIDERLTYTGKDAINKSSVPIVNVLSHTSQRHAVFTGASLFASMPQFPTCCHTKEQYDEYGPSIARQSRVFNV